LIGENASVRRLSRRMLPHVKWKQYPLYVDKERTMIDKDRIALYTTIAEKDPARAKVTTLDDYIFSELTTDPNNQ